MKKWSSTKLLVSTIVFLMVTMASSGGVEASSLKSTNKMTQKSFAKAVVKTPYIRLSSSKIVDVSKLKKTHLTKATKVGVRDVDYSFRIMYALMKLPLKTSKSKTYATNAGYGASNSGYVSMASASLLTGKLQLKSSESIFSKSLQPIMKSPEKFKLKKLHVNVVNKPKIFEMMIRENQKNYKGSLIGMAAWDFSKASSPRYDEMALANMLTRAYAAFKGYAQIEKKKGSMADIHTGKWGVGQQGNNAKVTTVLQIMAANLAGVDKLTFHKTSKSTLDSAKSFLAKNRGKNILQVIKALVVQSKRSGWQPG